MTHFDRLEDRRLFAGGGLDTTFANGAASAYVQFKVARGEVATLNKLVSDSGGRTYVLATTAKYATDATTLQIRRLTAAGTLDGGWAKTKSNNAIFPLDTTLQAYQTVPQIDAVVDGSDRLTLLLGTKVYRFTVGGTLDRTFGKKGVVTLTGMTNSAEIAADSTGRIYVVGSTATTSQFGQAVLDRLTADGQIDTTFQKTGSYAIPKYAPKGSIDVSSNGVAVRVLADNSVIVVADASYDIDSENGGTYTGTLTQKFTSGGAIDQTYGSRGIGVDFGHEYPASYNFDKATPAGIRSDGSVVVYRHGGDEQTSFGYNEVISPDGTFTKRVRFTTNGSVIRRDDINHYAVQFIAQADGSELVASPGIGLFRLLKNGAYDNAFNTGHPVNGVLAAAFQQDKTVVAGVYRTPSASITIERIFRDNSPVATLIAKPLTSPSATYAFNVQYRGTVGIAAGGIAANGIRVTASNGRYRYATLVGTTTLADHSVIAKYQLTDFTGSAWDRTNNATYSVAVLDGAVKDENGNAVQRRTLGNLTVAIA